MAARARLLKRRHGYFTSRRARRLNLRPPGRVICSSIPEPGTQFKE